MVDTVDDMSCTTSLYMHLVSFTLMWMRDEIRWLPSEGGFDFEPLFQILTSC